MELKSNEYIILRLLPDEENISFIHQTFVITEYVFFDERFRSSHFINENPEEIRMEYYSNIREKCLRIEEAEVVFTINEFIFFAKTVDFVAKCLIGEPKDKLEKVLASDFKNKDFDFEGNNKWYLKKSTNLIQDFRESCKNEKLLNHLSDALNWEIEI